MRAFFRSSLIVRHMPFRLLFAAGEFATLASLLQLVPPGNVRFDATGELGMRIVGVGR